ncbi:MAG: hypothetical protein KU38_00320 [Sulfurovum sp. FS08-3]|nr:MAG: hypothetical protein KU38_00320 [Sulfurovum sp. FS08-3]
MRDIKPLLNWAKQHGDANIHDRILMKVMPQLLKNDLKLTSQNIEASKHIEVAQELYDLIVEKTQDLIGKRYV